MAVAASVLPCAVAASFAAAAGIPLNAEEAAGLILDGGTKETDYLKIGDLRYRVNGKDENVFISGGFADVNNNVLSVLAESAELAGDIDAARAQAAKERAEKRLAAHDESVDQTRAEAALQRAVTRLQVAQLR